MLTLARHWWVTKEETGRLGVSWVVEFALHVFRLEELGTNTREAKSRLWGGEALRRDASLSGVPAKQICQPNIPDRALRGSEGDLGNGRENNGQEASPQSPFIFQKVFQATSCL